MPPRRAAPRGSAGSRSPDCRRRSLRRRPPRSAARRGASRGSRPRRAPRSVRQRTLPCANLREPGREGNPLQYGSPSRRALPRPRGEPHVAARRSRMAKEMRVAVGPDVREIEAGRRVAFLSSSAYADYDLVAQEALVPLPAAFDAQPFPGEPLGCAMNIFGRSDIRGGQIVAVVGVGFLGALLCRLASQAGASVIALARRPFAQRVARDFGARAVLPMDDHRRIVEEVRDLTAGRFCDRVIECAGAQSTLDLAGELTAERGRLVIAGFHQDGPRQVNLFLWNWRGLDVINAHERDPRVYLEGIRMAVGAVASGTLDPRPLYTHQFPLDRLGEAFEAVRTRPDGFLKALVRT